MHIKRTEEIATVAKKAEKKSAKKVIRKAAVQSKSQSYERDCRAGHRVAVIPPAEAQGST